MIVVDSSVWIANLRGERSRAVAKLHAIEDPGAILVGDIVLLEVLQGARNEAHAARIERALREFTIESMLNEALAARAAAHYRLLRQRGVTVRKTIDLVIATFCLERGHLLLHDDRDFDAMSTHLALPVV
ncbi:MAG TPA: PIN domain nuclease [Roseiarcus sp.]